MQILSLGCMHLLIVGCRKLLYVVIKRTDAIVPLSMEGCMQRNVNP